MGEGRKCKRFFGCGFREQVGGNVLNDERAWWKVERETGGEKEIFKKWVGNDDFDQNALSRSLSLIFQFFFRHSLIQILD